MQTAPADVGTIYRAVHREVCALVDLVKVDPDGTPVVLETLAERCTEAHARLVSLPRSAGQVDADITTAEAIIAAVGASAALAAGSVAAGPVVARSELVQSAHWLLTELWGLWQEEDITLRW